MTNSANRPIPRPQTSNQGQANNTRNHQTNSNTNTQSNTQSAQTPITQVTQTNPRDLDRSRASDAWQKIEQVSSTDKEYGSLARQMPTMIQVNGLVQTLSFLKAKKKNHHLKMFDHLSSWVCQQLRFANGDLLANAIRIESQEYRRATSESLAYLQWIKRFFEAKIQREEEV